jgi:anthranilate synthase/aminodeoxychorismate synthase-like glutamine amidotransferase
LGYVSVVILIIDNYDSFTYNLVQTIGALPDAPDMHVVRNDAATVEALTRLEPTHVIISPGPCTPREAGVSVDLVRALAGAVPILGVCLGHQCIAQAFGGRIVGAPRLMHGKTSRIRHDDRTIFDGLPNPFVATRYHSLTVDRASLPDVLEISAWTADRNELMGLRHRTLPIEGVQFHPESFLTVAGAKLLINFLNLQGGSRSHCPCVHAGRSIHVEDGSPRTVSMTGVRATDTMPVCGRQKAEP